PTVNGDTCPREIDQFLVRKLLSRSVVWVIGDITTRLVGDSLRPGKSAALPVRKELRFLPCRKCIESLFAFPLCPCVLRMHVDAEGAPIDSQTRTSINSINADSSFDDVGRVVKWWKSSWHHYERVEQLSIQLLRRRL